MIELRDKKVALLGYGVENRALLPYLLDQGAQVTVCDQNEELSDLPSGVQQRLGPDYLENLADFSIVFRTPGIPYLSRQLQEARHSGVTISSQSKLFMERCPAQMIGVTGTKGKGTTSSLIHAILQQSGKTSYLAGNIGQPPIELLEKLTEHDWVVLELSSFQLQDLTQSPHIAVVLTVGLDHMDHHRDEAEYISAKKNIVRYQTPSDFLVVHQDSLTSSLFVHETPAVIYGFSRLTEVEQGGFVDTSEKPATLVLRKPNEIDRLLCTTDDVQLVGDFNLENVLAASLAAHLAGASIDAIKEAVRQFEGLPHRLQFVAEKKGVRYFDNSYSTTPESAIASIQAFSQPITVILGGSSKGADFTELVEAVTNSSVSSIICIGQEGERLYELFEEAGGSQQLIQGGSIMTEIVRQAAEATEEGGIVLLSPACASFGMFKNYGDRGDQFQAQVKSL
jgi:UDP-N-acetylmuramoylalanine--D-glutamate ligase